MPSKIPTSEEVHNALNPALRSQYKFDQFCVSTSNSHTRPLPLHVAEEYYIRVTLTDGQVECRRCSFTHDFFNHQPDDETALKYVCRDIMTGMLYSHLYIGKDVKVLNIPPENPDIPDWLRKLIQDDIDSIQKTIDEADDQETFEIDTFYEVKDKLEWVLSLRKPSTT